MRVKGTRINMFDRPADAVPLVRVVVHTNGLARGIASLDPAVTAVLRLAELPDLRVVATPTADTALEAALAEAGIPVARQVPAAEGQAMVASPELGPLALRLPHGARAEDAVTPGSSVRHVDSVLAYALDMDLFVTVEGDPFEKERTPSRVVSPREALELVRILFANLGRVPVTAAVEVDEGMYYRYRILTVFPAYERAWIAAVATHEAGLPAGVYEQLHSLSKRLEFVCRAADRVSYFSLQRADNHTETNALYHLGYLVMLATGAFDDLAWIMSLLFGFGLGKRQVALRLKPGATTSAFYARLQAAEPALHGFLTSAPAQDRIRLFYPIRDALQHRTFLNSFLLVSWAGPRSRILFEFPDEAVAMMQALAGSDADDEWGVVTEAGGTFVDAHRFALGAVAAMAAVVNGVLDRLDWQRYVQCLPDAERARVESTIARFHAGVGRFLHWGAEPIYF